MSEPREIATSYTLGLVTGVTITTVSLLVLSFWSLAKLMRKLNTDSEFRRIIEKFTD